MIAFGNGRVTRLSLGLVAAVALAPDIASQPQELTRLTLISGAVPFRPASGSIAAMFPGEATLRVKIDDGRVVDVSIVNETLSDPISAKPILAGASHYGPAAASVVRSWRFASGQSGTFDAVFRYIKDPSLDPCDAPDTNVHVRLYVPTQVEVRFPPDHVCDRIARMRVRVPGTRRVNTLRGTVRCDCNARRPMSGASVEVQPDPVLAKPDRRRSRQVRADVDGSFRVDDLPEGRYLVTVGDAGDTFGLREYSVVISRTAEVGSNLEFLAAEAPAPPPPAPALVTAGAIPLYPAEAREQGVEGVVKLRLSTQGAWITDVNTEAASPSLARAAASNVRTWRFRDNPWPIVHVTFTYTLLPGDCGPDQRPVISMRLPAEIEITAKRTVPCAGKSG